ncbi:MAG: tetratricopeptide repeat protein [Acidobacteria bacterium]|nr:tetratricopeptide repeat protein [Acidobacteriota bacterium]
MKFCALLVALGLLTPVSLAARDDEPHHHEELTETQLGTVHFPSSCQTAVEKPIERGVAMLHSFWYEEAEKEFEQIEKSDPGCAIAHWGLAMSLWHQLWNRPDMATLERGGSELEKAGALSATPREKDYIAALAAFYAHPKRPYSKRVAAYSNAMAQVYKRQANDHEAAAFYALSLLAAEPAHDRNNQYRKRAAQVLEALFREEPNHPGVAHYLIHDYDKPGMAREGLAAARRYAEIAPAAPHALHMPAHIFARLGLWQDDIDSNVRSIEATQKEAQEHMGGEGHQFHAMDFLVYAYLQTGREEEARKIIDEVRAMPAMHDMYGMGFDPRFFALSVFPASYALELHRWNDAAQLELVSGAGDYDQSLTLTARAIGAARGGSPGEARKDIAQLEGIREKFASDKKNQGPYDGVTDELRVARAWLAFAEGKHEKAVRLLARVGGEEGEAEASQLIPKHEMIADMLLEAGRAPEALREYEASLETDPGRFDSLYGAALAAEKAGRHDKANQYYAALVKNCERATSERSELKLARARASVEANAASP